MARPLCFEAGQPQRCRRATGPNHELALVMAKERAGVMAEQVYCRWPVPCNLNATLQKEFAITICCLLRAIIY